jgi:hypothetical protein
MPIAGQKCIKCGSFQNWRRWLSIGDSTLALIIALLSVVGLTITSIQPILLSLYTRIFASTELAVVQATPTDLSAIVANPTEKMVVVDFVQCRVPVVRDWRDFLTQSETLGLYMRRPLAKETFGSVLISYSTVEKTSLQAGAEQHVDFRMDHITSVIPYAEEDLQIEASVYCLLSATNRDQTEDGDVNVLDAADLLKFDPVVLVSLGVYSLEGEKDRKRILDELSKSVE